MKTVILASGIESDLDHYQKSMGFDGNAIADHFNWSEFGCGGELLIASPLLKLLDAFRVEVGVPVKINSGYRTPAKQAALKADPRYKAATTSPHTVGMAADIDTVSWEQTQQYVAILKRVASETGSKI